MCQEQALKVQNKDGFPIDSFFLVDNIPLLWDQNKGYYCGPYPVKALPTSPLLFPGARNL